MQTKWIEIPIQRLREDRPLRSDVYLSLQLNKKQIKLMLANSTPDLEQLDRLEKKGITHLSLLCPIDESPDPSTFPVFKDSIPTSIEVVPTNKATTKIEQSFESIESTSAQKTESKPIRAVDSTTPSEELTLASAKEEPAAQSFSAEESRKEEAQKVSATAVTPLEENRIKALDTEDEVHLEVAIDESSGSTNSILPENKPKPEEIEADLQNISLEQTPITQEETSFSPIEKQKEQETRIQGAKEESNDPIRVKSQKPEIDSNESIQTFETTSGDEPQDLSLSRIQGSRDFPLAVSKLAATLGYSMGYSDLNYLSNLGISTIYYISKLAGHSLEMNNLPALVDQAVNKLDEKQNTLVSDAKSVILFLRTYTSHPDCDHSNSEFSADILQATIEKFDSNESEDQIDPWTLFQWKKIIAREENIDSQSLYSKASAKALKFARKNIPEEALPK